MEAPDATQNGDSERKRSLGASSLGSSVEAGEPPSKQARTASRRPADAKHLATSSGDLRSVRSGQFVSHPRSPCSEQQSAPDDEPTQQYKLRAMSLRFQELKRQLSSYEEKLKVGEEKQHLHDATISTVMGCWDQVGPDWRVLPTR